MARIRSIKPEFPQSEAIGKLSRDARLLFIMLWTLVDDDGRARAASRMLASLLYPYDDDAPSLIDDWLSELEQAGHIRIYDVDCSRYLDIPKWLKHQKIDHKSISRLPEFRESSIQPREPSRNLATDLGSRTLDQGPSTALRAVPDAKPKRARSTSPKVPLPDDWHPMEELSAENAVELQRFKDSARAHDRRYADWFAAWRNWKTSPFQRGKSNGAVQGYAGNAPRRGSRDDTRERMVRAIDRLDDFAEGVGAHDPPDGGEIGQAPIGGLPEPECA